MPRNSCSSAVIASSRRPRMPVDEHGFATVSNHHDSLVGAYPEISSHGLDERANGRKGRSRRTGQSGPAITSNIDECNAAATEPKPEIASRIEQSAVKLDRPDAQVFHRAKSLWLDRVEVPHGQEVESTVLTGNVVVSVAIARDTFGWRCEGIDLERHPRSPLETGQHPRIGLFAKLEDSPELAGALASRLRLRQLRRIFKAQEADAARIWKRQVAISVGKPALATDSPAVAHAGFGSQPLNAASVDVKVENSCGQSHTARHRLDALANAVHTIAVDQEDVSIGAR